MSVFSAQTHDQDRRIAAYKEAEISDIDAHDLIIRATDVTVCSKRLIPSVLYEWREPRHEAFEARNVWSLFNAFTESLKDGNLAELPKARKHYTACSILMSGCQYDECTKHSPRVGSQPTRGSLSVSYRSFEHELRDRTAAALSLCSLKLGLIHF